MIKTLLFLAVFLPALAVARLPDSCSILINKQVVFEGMVEQANPVVMINRADIRKRDCLAISYRAEYPDTAWKRTFMILDSLGNDIKRIEINEQSGCVYVRASVLAKMMDSKQPLYIHTVSWPKDPEVAKRVRVRTILLCKIEWN